MHLFREGITIEALNELNKKTLGEQIGIEFTAIGPDFIEARMPVDHRTHQPFGILHGGASVALAETLGGVASSCCIDRSTQLCVGIEINANHLRSVKNGYVRGTVKPIHIGKQTHVWEIRILNADDQLICISRITIAVLSKREETSKNIRE